MSARNSLKKNTPSMIKSAVELSAHGERMKQVDKKNDHAECL